MAILAAAILVMAGALAAGIVRVSETVASTAAAQSAADAAALAAVDGGEQAAREISGANGASVIGYTDDGETVTVMVKRGCCTAEATAQWSPADGP